MKNKKNPIYIRYEFSNESGRPEGGDILEVVSMKKIQELSAEILKVAHGDGVAVNLTIGEKKPFFNFLKSSGISMAAAEKEIVRVEMQPEKSESVAKKAKKAPAKKKAKK